MGVPNQPLPTIGQPNSTEDSKVRSALSELQTILGGNIDATNLATVIAQYTGITTGGVSRRGYSKATAEAGITSTAYVTDAGDADITVAQPAVGITLLIASVALHGSAWTSPGPVTGSSTARVGVRIDNSAPGDVTLGTTSSASYVGVNTVFPVDQPGTHTYRFIYNTSQMGGTSGGTSFFSSRVLGVVTLGF